MVAYDCVNESPLIRRLEEKRDYGIGKGDPKPPSPLSIDNKGFTAIMVTMISRQEVLPILEAKAKEIKGRYDDVPFQFLGGRFRVHIGIYGYLWIELNSDGRIMKIKTPEGAYLRP